MYSARVLGMGGLSLCVIALQREFPCANLRRQVKASKILSSEAVKVSNVVSKRIKS